jgi:hypothetical protein
MFAKGSSASSTRPVSEAKCRSLGEQILHEGPAVTFQMPGAPSRTRKTKLSEVTVMAWTGRAPSGWG